MALAVVAIVFGFLLVDLLWRVYVKTTIDPHEPDGLMSYALYCVLGGKLGVYDESILVPVVYSGAVFAVAYHRWLLKRR